MLKLDTSTAIDLFTPGFRQTTNKGPSRSWSYCSWVSNYLCNHCLSPI